LKKSEKFNATGSKSYAGWLRNPAPPTGWFKPEKDNGINHRFQLVQDFAGPSTGTETPKFGGMK
jgi:hypothetical protein